MKKMDTGNFALTREHSIIFVKGIAGGGFGGN
jgi:hypothetical protein